MLYAFLASRANSITFVPHLIRIFKMRNTNNVFGNTIIPPYEYKYGFTYETK